jgi:hypothetical protein
LIFEALHGVVACRAYALAWPADPVAQMEYARYEAALGKPRRIEVAPQRNVLSDVSEIVSGNLVSAESALCWLQERHLYTWLPHLPQYLADSASKR